MSEESTRWNDMATAMMGNWMDTSSQIWKSWFDLMGNMPTMPQMTNKNTPFAELSQRFSDNQQLFLKFLQLSFQAWQDVFPKVESGGNWQGTLKNYTEQMQEQLNHFSTSTLKTNQDRQKLWEIYLKEVQNLNQLWMASMGAFFQPMSDAITTMGEPWVEMNNVYWKLFYDENLSKYWQMPLVGPTRQFSGKLLKGFDAWSNLYRASQNYQFILADIQVKSFEALMEKLVEMAADGETVTDLPAFQRIWTSVADAEFEKAFCQEKNLKIRGEFLNSLNLYRLQQQELQEIWMKGMNMPSRQEIDEMHKTIYELRKEVKALKKALGE
ncbi:MAG: class III poly(R)-hydroxyalkanoic acid synthase subunit PhaE [Microcystaceae cyanobacterium]